MDASGLVTTGVRINLEKNQNTERSRFPDVRKKDSFLRPNLTVLRQANRWNSISNELAHFKESSALFTLQSTQEESDLNSSYVIISSSRIKTTSKNLRKSANLSQKDQSFDDSRDFTVEGISSPTHRKIIKKPEFQNTLKPRMPLLRKIDKIMLHSESSVKEVLFWNWINIIRSSNGFEVSPHKSQFRYFIGKGNNASLVHQVLKSRFWWTKSAAPEDANFVWTQIKHKHTLDEIPHFNDLVQIEPTQILMDSKIPKAILTENQESYGFKVILDSKCYCTVSKSYYLVGESIKAHNRLPNNSSICNKKEMFKNMKSYYDKVGIDVFQKVPLTFHVESGQSDPQFAQFLRSFTENSTWIIKPGEATNRGKGIKVCSALDEIKEIINRKVENRTYIIQKYIQNPLLINRRKFDIRCYALVTSFANHIQCYFYKDGYLRTSCKEFSLKNTQDKYIHLTNDAVQKNHEDYGKYETGNKLSYYDFQKFLNSNGSNKDFFVDIYPQITDIVRESIASVKDLLNSESKLNSFEVLGYDFMVDADYKVWLIEINTNPCLELSCSYLSKIIPDMLDNSFRIGLDPMFPPPESHKRFKSWVKSYNLVNKFLLIYSSLVSDLRLSLQTD